MFQKIENKIVARIAPLGLAIGLALGGVGVAGAASHGGGSVAGPYLTDAEGKTVFTGFSKCWKTVGGVATPVTECPNTPKGVEVNAFGCPLDTDRDGVADYMDKCPNSRPNARVNADGCEIVENITIQTTIDHFDFDSAELKPAMMSALDDVAAKLNASPGNQQVLVIAHTDSTGPEGYNQRLSERRAQAAADYLAGKGITNLSIKGMGESQPVADNGTREGRAANRRVEIVVK
ncbi:OmpA family protein [endosymbiont of unidentified scaly snail isolate Monju]|uniref:OmpA family protein n=1 Tax=endosymbiont of unidentified scaly snail isolate Monju TaxID=1248727 RepID=UPI0005D49399|nr:OmpA family protein [endosymbiont of unidentified scaly snail isolate Monju]